MRPMLASQGTVIPHGPAWSHEIKWDGMRLLADVREGRLSLTSRNENDATASFPELAGLAGLFEDMLLDGEVVALDGGVPSFGALAERMHVHDARRAAVLSATRPVTYMVFDLLRLYGVDLTGRPFEDRRATLERLELQGPSWRVPPMYDDGLVLQEATLEQGLEGVVSKKLSSTYTPGRRSTEWLKFPHRGSTSVVVGGWRREVDSDHRLGALLVGAPTAGGLRYLGRVGSGLAGRGQEAVLQSLSALAAGGSPFAGQVPRVDATGAAWVHPQVVVDVRALGLSSGGRLRQASFVGLRPDLSPGDLLERA
jgi:bifunctional non-homologous end joining protein LigD